MHHPLPAIDADMRLHTEVPLVAFPGLVHLGVALAALVLGRRGRMNNRRVYDRSGSDADDVLFVVLSGFGFCVLPEAADEDDFVEHGVWLRFFWFVRCL